MTEMGTLKHSKQLEFYMQHKQIEFKKFLDKAKIYRDTAVILKVLENARPAVMPVAQKKRYISELPILCPH